MTQERNADVRTPRGNGRNVTRARERRKRRPPRAARQRARAMLVGRERVERRRRREKRGEDSPECRSGVARRGATRPCVSSGKTDFRGAASLPPRLRELASSHAHIGQSPATDVGRRPAGRPASTAVARSLPRSDDDDEDDDARRCHGGSYVYAPAKQVEADKRLRPRLSFERANRPRPSVLVPIVTSGRYTRRINADRVYVYRYAPVCIYIIYRRYKYIVIAHIYIYIYFVRRKFDMERLTRTVQPPAVQSTRRFPRAKSDRHHQTLTYLGPQHWESRRANFTFATAVVAAARRRRVPLLSISFRYRSHFFSRTYSLLSSSPGYSFVRLSFVRSLARPTDHALHRNGGGGQTTRVLSNTPFAM